MLEVVKGIVLDNNVKALTLNATWSVDLFITIFYSKQFDLIIVGHMNVNTFCIVTSEAHQKNALSELTCSINECVNKKKSI